ncbi:MAG: GNAT family N-acetyltransferase [Pseudoruegeria sp.]
MTPTELSLIYSAAFPHSRSWSEREFADLLNEPFTYLCTCPNGFSLGRALAGEAELITIAVHPDAQGKGSGRILLRRFEEQACSHAADIAFLEVAANNMPAIRLYTASGYRESGRRRGYYRSENGQKTDALILKKSLICA